MPRLHRDFMHLIYTLYKDFIPLAIVLMLAAVALLILARTGRISGLPAMSLWLALLICCVGWMKVRPT